MRLWVAILLILGMVALSSASVFKAADYAKMFAQFTQKNMRQYAANQLNTRLNIFKANLDRITLFNAKAPGTLHVNALADVSRDEFLRMRGARPSSSDVNLMKTIAANFGRGKAAGSTAKKTALAFIEHDHGNPTPVVSPAPAPAPAPAPVPAPAPPVPQTNGTNLAEPSEADHVSAVGSTPEARRDANTEAEADEEIEELTDKTEGDGSSSDEPTFVEIAANADPAAGAVADAGEAAAKTAVPEGSIAGPVNDVPPDNANKKKTGDSYVPVPESGTTKPGAAPASDGAAAGSAASSSSADAAASPAPDGSFMEALSGSDEAAALIKEADAGIDWRSKNVLTKTSHQGSCGSCWSFATIATVEAFIAQKTGKPPVKLSESHLVDCDTANHGCNGGWYAAAYEHLAANGVRTEAAYGPYATTKKECRASSVPAAEGPKVSSYRRVFSPDAVQTPEGYETAMIKALKSGPVGIAIDAPDVLQFWGSKVLLSSDCNTSVNHAVVAVGTGVDPSGVKYWIVRNSWGNTWGDGTGHFRLERKSGVNTCGYHVGAFQPVIA